VKEHHKNDNNGREMDDVKQTIQKLQEEIVELQIIYTHQNNLITTLDEVIQEQFKQIEMLKQRQQQLINQLEGLHQEKNNNTYEKPPHY
jgi:uncharacterized coiled-coil protein SlyX